MRENCKINRSDVELQTNLTNEMHARARIFIFRRPTRVFQCECEQLLSLQTVL